MKAQTSNRPARRQSPARDTLRALALALGVHLAGFGLLWLGSLSWEPKRPPQISPSFTLVDATPYLEDQRQQRLAEAQAEAAERRLEQARREEAERQQALERQREQAREEEQRQAALEAQRQQQLEREAEQRRRRELAEERQRMEQERREAEQARLRELEDLRRQREQAQREREEQERRLAELADRRVQEEQRQRAEAESERLRLAREREQASEQRANLSGEYEAEIQALVTNNWNRPPTAQPGLRCKIFVVQSTGGWIINQSVANPCNADQVTKDSILNAVRRTERLPYDGYEDVFAREIEFTFTYDGN